MVGEKVLYKYRKPNDRTIQSLIDSNVWYSSPKTFNDPFDGFLELPKSREYGEFKTIMGSNLSNSNPFGDFRLGDSIAETAPGETSTAIAAIRSDVSADESKLEEKIKRRGLFCMADDPENILMWSHYAQNHEGICIGYSLDSSLYESYADLFEVKYTEDKEKPIVEPSDLTDTNIAIEKILTWKYKDWVYEKEWRLIHKDELVHGKDGLTVEAPGEIAKVIIGLKTPAKFVAELERLIPVEKLFKASYSYLEYQIIVNDYT